MHSSVCGGAERAAFHEFAGTRLLLLLLLSAEQRAMPYRRAAATCTGCGQPGHRKDNKRCPAYAINLELGIVKEKKRRARVWCPPHHTPCECRSSSLSCPAA